MGFLYNLTNLTSNKNRKIQSKYFNLFYTMVRAKDDNAKIIPAVSILSKCILIDLIDENGDHVFYITKYTNENEHD